MYPDSTHRCHRSLTVSLAAMLLAPAVLTAQPAPPEGGLRLEWRRLGNAALDLALASAATGPLVRVWRHPGSAGLFVQTLSGRVLSSADLESWLESTAEPPPIPAPAVSVRLPEPGARVLQAVALPTRLYAIGRFVHRSDDGGANWINLTSYQGDSILGEGLHDLSISSSDPDDIAVAAGTGLWRSLDGGLSWYGLNETLPNLPAERILSLPAELQGIRILAGGAEFEWRPGESRAWRLSRSLEGARERRLWQAYSAVLNAEITAVAAQDEVIYAGSGDGRLWSSVDGGAFWTLRSVAGRIESIFLHPGEPRLALAAVSLTSEDRQGPQILRTINGGLFWDDLTANLPAGSGYGVTADRDSGVVYAATSRGVYFTRIDLTSAGPPTPWTRIDAGLPVTPARDIRLDPAASRLFVALEGYGIFTAAAPHRLEQPRVVNAADYASHPAAPGTLLSVLGASVRSARAGNLPAPVLAASDEESQVQVPFEVQGSSISIAFDSPSGALVAGMPLRSAAPVIFVDRDGAPMLLDGETGLLLDASAPARAGSRIQILATGLGRVRPEWPTGVPAPFENTPAVVVPVRVYLDGAPVEVTRATLAPGYVGFYLVEVQVPEIVNTGPAELYIEADGQRSNRVRIYLEPQESGVRTSLDLR